MFPSSVFFLVGPVHYLQDPQTTFFNKNNFKIRSQRTIHIFKNYFITLFSVLSKLYFSSSFGRIRLPIGFFSQSLPIKMVERLDVIMTKKNLILL